jgi:hypothetical protein
VNRWLTWRARLSHVLNPHTECLCHTCARARAPARALAEQLQKNQFRIRGELAPRPRPDDWEGDCDRRIR